MMTGLLLFFALPERPRVPAAPLASSVPQSAPAARDRPAAPPASAQVAVVPPSAMPPPSVAVPAAPEAPAVAQAPQPVKDEWPADEVARAREQCMHVLSSTPADIEWLEPVKKGSCGLPAPIRLKSVGASPKVVFDPPVQVNCRMVVALSAWSKSSLQPEAKARFKSEVVRIVGASGYSCRNIYNLPNARLSQHALANAIDIGGFGLANGRVVGVLKGWGLTQRDVVAQAKAKAAAEAKAKAAAEAKAKSKKDDAAKDAKEAKAIPVKGEAKATGARKASLSPVDLAAATKANGGADEAIKKAAPPKSTAEAQFLRAIHSGACGPFGTVLGPEANDPHRNHFHLDLIARRGRGYCE